MRSSRARSRGSQGTTDSEWNAGWSVGGLVGLLVLIAAIVLLFTGRYPKPLYDFVPTDCRCRAHGGSSRSGD